MGSLVMDAQALLIPSSKCQADKLTMTKYYFDFLWAWHLYTPGRSCFEPPFLSAGRVLHYYQVCICNVKQVCLMHEDFLKLLCLGLHSQLTCMSLRTS